MGNSSTKEVGTSPGAHSRPDGARQAGSSAGADRPQGSTGERPTIIYNTRSRGSRRESFLGIGGGSDAVPEPRKETKAERDARKAEKERVAREKERERSIREEGVDGAYLVTMGTYTGAEDFSKPTVRQLMIERRIAPFWRGLNDHSESWTENQLVAAARGLPIPAPDEIPSEDHFAPPPISSQPIAFRPTNYEHTSHLSGSQPFSTSGQDTSPSSTGLSSSPLFRGRSKTLASLSSKSGIQPELTPQEIRLPHEPYVHGQPMEAYLYKDAIDCPICFLSYPPYLNKTRCCDQPICSECFVQIKRPEPHLPEHTDQNVPLSPEAQQQADEGQLVSEPAQCPFCVQPEFGVSYEPPPFRRGLAYASNGRSSPLVKVGSAMSSSSSLSSPPSNGGHGIAQAGRRRATSLSASAPQVITTDKIRPDWAKKLSDARAQAARRSAAATALHNAAYLMGGNGGLEQRLGLGRRRRNFFTGETAASSGNGTPSTEALSIPNMEALLAALESQASTSRNRHGSSNVLNPAMGSRGSRVDDLEEVMLMEAIRQSLAAEEERKKKEDKENVKEAKKEEKKKAKDQKKADKIAKKNGSFSVGSHSSSMFYSASPTSSAPAGLRSFDEGKGKAKAPNIAIAHPSLHTIDLSQVPTSSTSGEASPRNNPQLFLEQSRAHLDSEASQSHPRPIARPRPRHSSDASSSASSFLESAHGSVRNAGSDSSFNVSPNTSGHHLPFGMQTSDLSSPNMPSLAAVLDKQGDEGAGSERMDDPQGGRSRGGTGDSSGSAWPPRHEQHTPIAEGAPEIHVISPGRSTAYQQKHMDDVNVLDQAMHGQTTQ